ncbi:NAD-dependent succinate-semialdehyde dehydrogenase [Paraburkholderia tropica]|uniref:NAD-dependent succinate-semialdehyde dehydrogenase n=1 Tax=Paraburkholderia tropica TaxID=92647 RepID=UPI002AB73E94|nr:NAD-dependent succinate-semialdehyde dehydrogenase [Paraburkholderia tropica]
MSAISIAEHLRTYCKDVGLIQSDLFVAGEWRRALDAARFDVLDPADGTVLASVANASADDARTAIDAAHGALGAWSALTGHARGIVMRRWYDLIRQHAGDLAALISAEGGKPYAEAQGEVAYGASFVEWFAEEARRVDGDVLQSPRGDQRILVIRQPIGVCAAITPWNFPFAMITRKVAPALAAGCAIVVKPAEQTPLTALALAELARRAGVPAGVCNIVTADAQRSIEVGRVLTTDPRVHHVSFTGSTEVGRILLRQCASTVKKCAMELGGHAPFIVFDDADLDAAVAGALTGKYRNAGQACISPNRFFVQSGIYERFVAAVAEASTRLRVGRAFDDGVAIGPLIDSQALAKVQRHVDDATRQGATLAAGGKPVMGNFFEPTVLAGVTPAMQMFNEETFGPVIGIARFDTEEEVIAMANHAEYGLAGYLYTRDISRMWRVGEALEFGMLGINSSAISNEVAPFGGVKQSGMGREGSKYGIDEYLQMKYLCVGI